MMNRLDLFDLHHVMYKHVRDLTTPLHINKYIHPLGPIPGQDIEFSF